MCCAAGGGIATVAQRIRDRYRALQREATRPEQVGLPSARGRRTPGLRREEVAMLAGVSLTW